jgi:hypothetical protein
MNLWNAEQFGSEGDESRGRHKPIRKPGNGLIFIHGFRSFPDSAPVFCGVATAYFLG